MTIHHNLYKTYAVYNTTANVWRAVSLIHRTETACNRTTEIVVTILTNRNRIPLTLTHDLDFQAPGDYGHDPYTCIGVNLSK